MDRRLVVPLAVTLMTATGCGLLMGEAGFSRISSEGFDPIGPTSTYVGVVALRDNGCIFLDSDDASRWVVWPPGAKYESTDQHDSNIRLSDGTKVESGDHVRITGELLTISDLPQGANQDSMWGAHSRFCFQGTDGEPEILRAESVIFK